MHPMDDAQLDMRLRVGAVYRIRETLKATIFQLRQHIQPELCAFIFGQPHAQRQENGSVYYAAILTDFYDNALRVNNGIQRIQLPDLPPLAGNASQ